MFCKPHPRHSSASPAWPSPGSHTLSPSQLHQPPPSSPAAHLNLAPPPFPPVDSAVIVEGHANIPEDGVPTILVSNHVNSLTDALLLVTTVPRHKRQLLRLTAKASQFARRTFTSWLIEAAGTLPIQRPKDAGGKPVDNSVVFGQLIEALEAGDMVVSREPGWLTGPDPAFKLDGADSTVCVTPGAVHVPRRIESVLPAHGPAQAGSGADRERHSQQAAGQQAVPALDPNLQHHM